MSDSMKDMISEKFDNFTRVEVIDAEGRSYTNWNVSELQFSIQDDGRTLKIFIKEKL